MTIQLNERALVKECHCACVPQSKPGNYFHCTIQDIAPGCCRQHLAGQAVLLTEEQLETDPLAVEAGL